jgi:Zn-dependent protease
MEVLLKIVCLVVAIVLHELSHGLMAYIFGDRTAQYAGRLSLNPISHIDPIGSIILPFILFFTGAPFLIGWAKPVPVNFINLRPQKLGVFLVAFAGPLMNIFLALIASILWKMGVFNLEVANAAIQINVILAAFNLLPILPLDGGRMITCFLPQNHKFFYFFERFGLVIVIGALMMFSGPIHKLIFGIANMILALLNTLI